MSTLAKDLLYAFRILKKSPGFTTVVVLSLALGIGANTAIFSLVNAYLLRPMPVDDPSRLVAIYLTSPSSGNSTSGFSYPDLLDFRKENTGLSDLMGSSGFAMNLQDGETPELAWGEIVTGNYFSGLGVHPIIGRGFLPEEDRAPGQQAVCVINYNFWRRHFNGDPKVAGKTIKVNGHPLTIVGVAPRGFIGINLFNFIPDVWVPVMMQQTVAPGDNYLEGRGNRWISLRGRLKPGATQRQAETALNVVARRLANEYPQTNRGLQVHVISGGGRTQPFLVASGLLSATTGIMSVVVFLVLLIACANVANLMLARATSRAREMAIRVAIGAGRLRLIRQLLTESVLLSLAGGALGVILSLWMGAQLKSFYPTLDFQTADIDYETQFDPRILIFTVLISLVTAVLFGLLPALRASKVDLASSMKGESVGARAGRIRFGRGNLLVMLQVALSSLLLIFGGLFLRSMQFANRSDPGFYRTGITMFSVNLDLQGYDKTRGLQFQSNLVDRLRSIPGVNAASVAFPLPLDAYSNSYNISAEGYVPRSDREDNSASMSSVGPQYFETMGTAIVSGRAIDGRDTSAAPPVAVVNQTMARRYWQTEERAIGRRFRVAHDGPLIQVVGVAKDGKYATFGEPATMYFFQPLAQNYEGRVTVLARSTRGPDSLMPAIRQQMRALDAALPIFGVRTVPQYLNRVVAIYDMGASLAGTFAVMALLLAAVGIYGVLHFTVSRRTREIGIRMALGAPTRQVLRLVLQRSLLWVTAGIVLGAGIAIAAGGITARLLAGVGGNDPLTILAVVVLFGAIAFIASLVPARRAARVDPIQALRYE